MLVGSGCSVIVSNPSAKALEPRADAEQRAVLEQVGLEQCVVGALHVVDVERAVADDAGPADAARLAELEAVGGERLPREDTADAETADIGSD
jgi:hypothetical protein